MADTRSIQGDSALAKARKAALFVLSALGIWAAATEHLAKQVAGYFLADEKVSVALPWVRLLIVALVVLAFVVLWLFFILRNVIFDWPFPGITLMEAKILRRFTGQVLPNFRTRFRCSTTMACGLGAKLLLMDISRKQLHSIAEQIAQSIVPSVRMEQIFDAEKNRLHSERIMELSRRLRYFRDSLGRHISFVAKLTGKGGSSSIRLRRCADTVEKIGLQVGSTVIAGPTSAMRASTRLTWDGYADQLEQVAAILREEVRSIEESDGPCRQIATRIPGTLLGFLRRI